MRASPVRLAWHCSGDNPMSQIANMLGWLASALAYRPPPPQFTTRSFLQYYSHNSMASEAPCLPQSFEFTFFSEATKKFDTPRAPDAEPPPVHLVLPSEEAVKMWMAEIFEEQNWKIGKSRTRDTNKARNEKGTASRAPGTW